MNEYDSKLFKKIILPPFCEYKIAESLLVHELYCNEKNDNDYFSIFKKAVW